MFLCDLIVWSHSICTRNLGNLWWLVMKIWMIMWKHKMAPGWRHGWVITLKRGGARFLMMPNILWKFEHDCTVCFWDKWITKFVEKLFVYFSYKNNFSLEVICHADKLRWYASTEWIDNLTTFPTSDCKLETTLPIVHSLSYDILNLGRKWSYNNRDTAQRSLPCRFMFGKKWPPIDNTQIW